jgi:uncharacterized protein (DUF2336 family)
MSSPVSLLPELDQVLEHGSASRRAATLLSIATLFCESAARFNSEHVGLFGEVFDRLVEEVDRNARIELSRLLAPVNNAPAETIARLAADDDAAVAAPVLEHASRLDEPDLANIARQKSQLHLLAICARNGPGQAITDILIRRGSREVLHRLAANPSAGISDEGFGMLVERAGADGELAAKLAGRADFPPRIFQELLLHADEGVREHLIAGTAKLQPALRQIVEQWGEMPPRDYAAAQSRIVDLHQKGMLDESKVVEFASNQQRDNAVAAVALLCAVPIEVVDRVMFTKRLDPILILCKSAGWSWQTVRALVTALPAAASIPEQALDVAYANFERLSPTTAQRVMRFWQVQHWQPSPAPV